MKNDKEPNLSIGIHGLFRGVINEMREPIIRIKGFCQILSSTQTENLTEQQIELIKLITNEIEKIETGINTYRKLYREHQKTEK